MKGTVAPKSSDEDDLLADAIDFVVNIVKDLPRCFKEN